MIAEMSEWSNVLVSKTGIPQGIEGSNPSLCAKHLRTENKCFPFFFAQKKRENSRPQVWDMSSQQIKKRYICVNISAENSNCRLSCPQFILYKNFERDFVCQTLLTHLLNIVVLQTHLSFDLLFHRFC